MSIERPLIACDGLTKQYGETMALDHLDLTVAEGEISCLLGPNGSGKTTTVALLTTLRAPTAGTATVCGFDVSAQPNEVRASVGVALQRTGVDDLMTGRETLELQAALRGMPRRDGKRRVDDLVALLGLDGHADTRLGTWSGGLRRRLDLAIALVGFPRLLVLDEPTNGLDPASRRSLWAEIGRLNREHGLTVLLTTQNLAEADFLADRVSILDRGHLAQSAAPGVLKEEYGERTMLFEFVSPAHIDAAQQLIGGDVVDGERRRLRVLGGPAAAPHNLARLAAAGLDVVSFTMTEPTLEDVFLRLTTEEIRP